MTEADFYSVLKTISYHLKSISESLSEMSRSKKRESDQFIKESMGRMRAKRIQMLNESRKSGKAKNQKEIVREILGENKDNQVNNRNIQDDTRS